jgi:vancomycin resistance protein VanW
MRREMAWRGSGVNVCVDRRDPAGFPHVVASHSTPLFRRLSGVDQELQRNKAVNLRIAAGRLDGVVLDPGVRLSFWHEVGKPSRRRGFVDGLILSHGRLATGVGGGLCQMTNLLYWMTLHTPLSVVERWRHTYDVFPDTQRTQPFGSGATCAWPLLDLAIENRTSSSYRLALAVTDTQLVGSWSSTEPSKARYEIRERGHRFTHDGPGVYVRRNEIWRLTYPAGETTPMEELVAENAALMMYAPFLPSVGGTQPSQG